MKESLNRIEDQEIALKVAYAEKPLRDLAAQAIAIGEYWAQPAYEAATASAISYGQNMEEFYLDKRAKEIKRAETISQLSEIDTGKEVFVTRADLTEYAQAQGYTLQTAYLTFNQMTNNRWTYSEVELFDVISEDRESVRLDGRVVSLLRTVLTSKQFELIESYYGAF